MRQAAVLSGLGSWLPPQVVTNDRLARQLDTSDEWIRRRTGIGQRHIAGPGIATSDLAIEAGRRALKSAATDRADCVIVATTTPDHPCPATAPMVAAKLGLGTVPAFDVAAVCAGFLYAGAVAEGLIAAGTVRTALVIGADTFSSILDPEDRTTRCVFGDGAGAAYLRAGSPEEPGALGPFTLGSDGTGADMIMVGGGGSRQPLRAENIARSDPYFRMQGKAVFRHAVERMSTAISTAIEGANWTLDDVEVFVTHQANLRIMQAVASHLGVPPERFPVHLDRVGNTAAASVPLTLVDAASAGTLRAGQRTVLEVLTEVVDGVTVGLSARW
ncbi:beta-ketoacyl-ACP synthase III, partial [Streptomyces flavofungini]